ncbi:acyltransferase family protein [Hymenobacter volaticus]|uniref:acyltransferase family protein n=1 Tax=Hymenobacter volaticus TaxID=2932254 RepID=UPI0035C9DA4B
MAKELEITPRSFEYGLEALRGFAALIVVISHIINYGKFIDPGYFPVELTSIYNGGHLMVLIFLVLSGFVISVSTQQIRNWYDIKIYLYKRFIRIYPIYVLCVFLTLLVASTSYSFFAVASNLAFVNVLFSNVLLDNGPIWSLHYEVLFYIVFILIAYYKLNPIKIGLLAAGVGLANFFLVAYSHVSSLTSYCFGFTFWIAGVAIANYFKTKEARTIEYRKLVSYLFLLLTLPYFNGLTLIAEKLSFRYYGGYIEFSFDGNMNHWFKNAFAFLDLTHLIYCCVGVLVFTNSRFKYKHAVLFIIRVLPLYSIWNTKHYYPETLPSLVVPLCCYILSWLLLIKFELLERVSMYCIRFLIWTGGISYALYVLHIPILLAFNKTTLMSGTLATYIFRVLLYLLSVFVIAYIIEKKFQPWIRNIVWRNGVSPDTTSEKQATLLKS